jgi:hypothetical protein
MTNNSTELHIAEISIYQTSRANIFIIIKIILVSVQKAKTKTEVNNINSEKSHYITS